MSDGPTARPAVRAGRSRSQLQDEMEHSFLDYAMSVIMSRALPDVRDGLKPVHRRIIWDMDEQGFRPDRTVRQVRPRHRRRDGALPPPRRQSAIYDALVRMAQPFSLRHPLIDFHGNYGSPDFGAGRRALHGVPAGAARDAAARRHRRGHRRHGAQLRRLHRGADGAAGAVPEPARQRQPGHRRRHGHEHPAAQPRRGHRRHDPPDRQPRGHPRRPDAVRQGPRLPDRRPASSAAPGSSTPTAPGGAASKLRATADDRGDQGAAATADRRHRAAVPDELLRRSPARIQELVDAGDLEGIADVNDELGRRQDRASSSRSSATPTPTSCSTTCTSSPSCRRTSPINMVALVDGVPRTLNLAQALARLRRPPGRGHHPALASSACSKAQDRAHILEGRIKALDVIDAIIALDPRPATTPRRQGRADGRAVRVLRDARPIDILDMQLRQLTRLSRIDLETELADVRDDDRRARGDPRRRRCCCAGHQGRAGCRSRRSSPRRGVCQITLDSGEMSIEDLVDDKELVVVMTEAQYVKSVPAGAVQDPGAAAAAAWQRRQAQGRRPRPPRHLHHGPRLPAVLLQPRQGVPPAGARDPRARAHGQGHADRQPAAAAAGRDDPGDHRHPRLRRRALPVLRHPQGHGEEDGVRRLRLEPPRRADRHQPARRRRAGAGHRDRRRRRHLHGQPQGHDDPLHRGRRAPDGPHARPACAA